ncbi:MAG TPA: hypothetical protein VNO70_15550, partial [Blastocatellia bacterium]|nr:hypothetical protein [Blastocatellia bacterium]
NRPQVNREAESVAIPDDIGATRAKSLADHLNWRLRAREDFQRQLARGRIVCGFAREPETGLSRYYFGDDEDQFHFEAYKERVITGG